MNITSPTQSQIFTNSLIRITRAIQNICQNSFQGINFDSGASFNIDIVNTKFPLLFIEPTNYTSINSIENGGVRVGYHTMNIYSLDRISKGDINYMQTSSDTLYVLQVIESEIRDSNWFRQNYISLQDGESEMKAVWEVENSNLNGWIWTAKIRIPIVFTPCINPVNYNL